MAALVYGTNVVRQWVNSSVDRTALYSMSDFNAGDTISLSNDFLVLNQVTLLGITPTAAVVTPTFAGTVVTMPVGAATEAGYMVVFGESSGS